jgi:hypothetical protein
MQLSLLLPFLLALGAAALPAPSALLDERDVGILNCTTVYTGPLSFAGIEGDAVGQKGYAAFVGKRDAQGSQSELPRRDATRGKRDGQGAEG